MPWFDGYLQWNTKWQFVAGSIQTRGGGSRCRVDLGTSRTKTADVVNQEYQGAYVCELGASSSTFVVTMTG